MAYEISNQWVSVSIITGIPIGDSLNIQNAGRAGDVVELILSATQPNISDRGDAVKNLDPRYRVSGQSLDLWIRYIRYDLNGTITPEDARKCLVNISNNERINESSSLPVDAYTQEGPSKRLKVSTATRQEAQIARGEFFNGASLRPNIPPINVYTSVLKAPPNKFAVIEDAIIDIDYNNVTNGSYTVNLDAYVDTSNGNDWSYTPANPVPAGRPLSGQFINDVAEITIDLGIGATIAVDNPDYRLYFSSFYRDTQGGRESVSGTGSSFFEAERQIILEPNQEILIKTETAGTAGGTANLEIVFFLSEIAVEDAPTLLGIVYGPV